MRFSAFAQLVGKSVCCSRELRIFRCVASAAHFFILGGSLKMNLYSVYDFCHSLTPFLAILFFLALSNLLSFLTASKQKKEPKFLIDDIFTNLSFKNAKIFGIVFNLLLVFVMLLSSNTVIVKIGCDDIRAMPEGTYCCYVYATNNKDKTYTLPAKVSKINRREYYIENIYFKNGGYLYFADGDYFEFEDTAYEIDQSERGWHIKLTNKKASYYKVKENMKFDNSDILSAILGSSSFLMVAILHFIHLIKYNKFNYKS